jgi:site-specific DNA recombinase
MSTIAVLYARFSPRPGAETCESVEKQIERCRAYCHGHSYEVVSAFHDKDLSGGRMDNRPGLQKAISAACRQKAVLCVYSLSRLARCTRDAIELAERLNTAGADLAVIQENVNTRSPMGRFIFTLFSALAQLEREQIAERTSSAMLKHQTNGRRMTRADRCPYGWCADPADPGRLVEDVGEQAAIARILKARENGGGMREIARMLDRAGIDCRGNCWSHSGVRSVLRRAGQLAQAS